MTDTTRTQAIPYPVGSDTLVKLPEHLKAMADRLDTLLSGHADHAATVDTHLAEIDTTTSDHAERLTALDATTAGHADRLGALDAGVAQLSTDLAALETTIDTTDGRIDTTDGRIDTLAAAIETGVARSGTDLASIDTNNATIGQQAYVYDSDETKKAHAGPYWYYGGQWARPAQAAVIFNLIPNDDWLLESWQWQTFGQPYIYLRVRAKRDIVVTESNHAWTIGTFTEDAYKPPTYLHFTAYTNENHAANFGFSVGANGLLVETFVTGFTFNRSNLVFAMLTWPCPNIGGIRQYATS